MPDSKHTRSHETDQQSRSVANTSGGNGIALSAVPAIEIQKDVKDLLAEKSHNPVFTGNKTLQAFSPAGVIQMIQTRAAEINHWFPMINPAFSAANRNTIRDYLIVNGDGHVDLNDTYDFESGGTDWQISGYRIDIIQAHGEHDGAPTPHVHFMLKRLIGAVYFPQGVNTAFAVTEAEMMAFINGNDDDIGTDFYARVVQCNDVQQKIAQVNANLQPAPEAEEDGGDFGMSLFD